MHSNALLITNKYIHIVTNVLFSAFMVFEISTWKISIIVKGYISN